MNHVYAVIMAGGRGERLWPLSTPERPKQFLNLFGERTMLQQTVDRVLPLVSIENVYVITAAEHVPLVKEQLPEVPDENIVGEPVGRGTAPCVGLAALLIHQRDPEGVMLALAADHVIKEEALFRALLQGAIEIAAQGTHLLTFGIDPTRPETGYGYIHAPNAWQSAAGVFEVSRFTEKPDRETAARFMQEGTYYWNSGMFVWRVDTILEEIEQFLPELREALGELRSHIGTPCFQEELAASYPRLAKISIDHGVMEKSTRTLLIRAGKIDWSDVGGWEALRELLALRDKPWGYEHLW
ncbi:mannose-1-phosphate guanylyltransferase, partial [Candidatus Bipolaricaulota bacterium]